MFVPLYSVEEIQESLDEFNFSMCEPMYIFIELVGGNDNFLRLRAVCANLHF